MTGIRVGEAVSLSMGSLDGLPGGRHLMVVGHGAKSRSIPVHGPLEAAIGGYLLSRAARCPGRDLDGPGAPLFVDARGHRMSANQVKYLIERLYVRAGIRARVPSGALVHALRHTFASPPFRPAPMSSISKPCSGTPLSTRPADTSNPPPPACGR